MTTKPCARCKSGERVSHMAYCRQCTNEYSRNYRRERYRNEPDYREKMKATATAGRYKLSLAEFKALGDSCEICGSKEKLHVDHCHNSGKVRGLLCQNCNWGLGNFQDSPSRLKQAMKYLTREATFDN